MNRRALTAVLVTGLSAGLALWVADPFRPGAPPPAPPPTTSEPTVDYAMEAFELTSMGVQGAPRYRIQAEQLLHFQQDGRATLLQPRVVFLQNEPVWRVRADRGQASADGQVIELHGAVRILRAGDQRQGPVEIALEQLHLRPDEQYAESNGAVQIRQAGSLIESQGIRVYLGADRVQLVSKVQGHYAGENP